MRSGWGSPLSCGDPDRGRGSCLLLGIREGHCGAWGTDSVSGCGSSLTLLHRGPGSFNCPVRQNELISRTVGRTRAFDLPLTECDFGQVTWSLSASVSLSVKWGENSPTSCEEEVRSAIRRCSHTVTQTESSGVEKWTHHRSLSGFSPWGVLFHLYGPESPAHWGSSPWPCRTLIMGISSFLGTSRPDLAWFPG